MKRIFYPKVALGVVLTLGLASTSVAAMAAPVAEQRPSSPVVAGQAFAAAAAAQVDSADDAVSPQAVPAVVVTAVVIGAYNLVGGWFGTRSVAETAADFTAFD